MMGSRCAQVSSGFSPFGGGRPPRLRVADPLSRKRQKARGNFGETGQATSSSYSPI